MNTALNIVKIGGKLINDPSLLESFLLEFQSLHNPKILVHGGGRKATELSALLGVETKIVEGRRITDKETLDIAIMVYGGLINKNIVTALHNHEENAIGLCGADANIILAKKRTAGNVDYGFVGDIIQVNSDRLENLFVQKLVPVIAPLTHDGSGQLLNTNADTIASRIALAFSEKYEVTLRYCFEYDGVLYDLSTPELTISSMSKTEFDQMRETGSINSGMIPKLTNGFEAVLGGVREVSICGITNLISQKGATSLTL